MRKLANRLWNYPTVFIGALQASNAVLAAEHLLPTVPAVIFAAVLAGLNYAAVKPAYPRR